MTQIEEKPHMTLPEILNIPPKLLPVVSNFNDYMLFLLEGGRGSAKSHSIARLILYLGEQRKLRIVCGREIQANIEESVYTLMKDLIDQYDLAYQVMAFKIKHKYTGTEINFKGFREQGNVSVKGLEGVDILWIDEAQSITKPTLDIIIPTVVRKSNPKIFFTMNRFLREDAVPEYAMGREECLHIHINYFDNPFCPQALKIEAEECKKRSERDYKHIWLGEPISQADDYLFNFDKLHGAYDVQVFGDFFGRQRILAFDFAAQGNDLCVATVLDRVSNQHWKPVERLPWDESDTMISVGKIINYIGKFKPTLSVIDIGGMGKVVYDRLIEVGIDIRPFDGGSTKGVNIKHYANHRAFGYYTLRDWFDSGFLSLDREQDRETVNELEKIKMKYRSNGSRVIQAKTDMKKELGFSPDNADSLMMAVWAATNLLGKESNTIHASSSNGSEKIIRRTGSSRHRRRK